MGPAQSTEGPFFMAFPFSPPQGESEGQFAERGTQTYRSGKRPCDIDVYDLGANKGPCFCPLAILLGAEESWKFFVEEKWGLVGGGGLLFCTYNKERLHYRERLPAMQSRMVHKDRCQ